MGQSFNREFSPWRLKVQRSCPLRSSGTDAGVVANPQARIVGPLASKQVAGKTGMSRQRDSRLVGRKRGFAEKRLYEGKRRENSLPQQVAMGSKGYDSDTKLSRKWCKALPKHLDKRKELSMKTPTMLMDVCRIISRQI